MARRERQELDKLKRDVLGERLLGLPQGLVFHGSC